MPDKPASKFDVILAVTAIVAVAFVFGVRFYMTRPQPPQPPVHNGSTGPDPLAGKLDQPGAKILQGADRAYETGYPITALKFYRDFDLRYAGSDLYDSQAERVWERMKASEAVAIDKDPELADYLQARRRLHEEWKRLRARPRAEAKEDLQKYRAALPPDDGRRAIIDGWLEKP